MIRWEFSHFRNPIPDESAPECEQKKFCSKKRSPQRWPQRRKITPANYNEQIQMPIAGSKPVAVDGTGGALASGPAVTGTSSRRSSSDVINVGRSGNARGPEECGMGPSAIWFHVGVLAFCLQGALGQEMELGLQSGRCRSRFRACCRFLIGTASPRERACEPSRASGRGLAR